RSSASWAWAAGPTGPRRRWRRCRPGEPLPHPALSPRGWRGKGRRSGLVLAGDQALHVVDDAVVLGEVVVAGLEERGRPERAERVHRLEQLRRLRIVDALGDPDQLVAAAAEGDVELAVTAQRAEHRTGLLQRLPDRLGVLDALVGQVPHEEVGVRGRL